MRATVGHDGVLLLGGERMRCALGRGGISTVKREGDGATPAGLLPLRQVFYRADRVARPRAAVPVELLAEQDGWCDDPAHRDYNMRVRLPHPGRHEALWRRDGLYDIVGVLGWNDRPVERGRGSAIFLHVARAGMAPTEGCLALELGDLVRVLGAGLEEVFVG